MNHATHVSTEAGLGCMYSSPLTSNTPDSSSAAETDRKSERGLSYGIAGVFALMLVLVVTLCVMLWAR
jgi:hypothetical protein